MASTSSQRAHLHDKHSIWMTETFIFGVFVAAAAISLPLYFASGDWGSKPQEAVSQAAAAVSTSTERILAEGPTIARQVAEKPVPYLRQLPNLFPYLLSLPYLLRVVFFDWPIAVARPLLIPISYLFYVLGQLFAPVIILAQVVFDIAIRAPWNAIVWVAGLLYPVYVFCGVAALVGALFGLAGVGVGKLGLWLASTDDGEEWGSAPDPRTRTSAFPLQDRKGKGKAREIKLEEPAEATPKRGRRVEFAS